MKEAESERIGLFAVYYPYESQAALSGIAITENDHQQEEKEQQTGIDSVSAEESTSF